MQGMRTLVANSVPQVFFALQTYTQAEVHEAIANIFARVNHCVVARYNCGGRMKI